MCGCSPMRCLNATPPCGDERRTLTLLGFGNSQGVRVEDVELGGRSVNTTAMQWHPTQRVLAMGRADGEPMPPSSNRTP